MPNQNAPSGFQSGRPFDARAPNWGSPIAYIMWNYATQIAAGDPVFLAPDGTMRLVVAGGTTVHGIFRGCKYYDPGQQRTSWFSAWRAPTLLANTIVEAFVDSAENDTFRCQTVGAAAVTQAQVGLNIDLVGGSSGTPNAAGISTAALNQATIAATATFPFRIVGIVGYPNPLSSPGGPYPGYDATLQYNWVEVMMNTYDQTTRTGQA
jgi:hypothetical protein